ncbi:MAG: hypothetical protein PQJ44_09500 [Sphaerochaetaceae bacterium]|nr:hypothetical protein [Sphaerochaetaceae bacterium]
MFDLVSYLTKKRAEAYHTIQELEEYYELEYLENEIGLKSQYDQQYLVIEYISNQIDQLQSQLTKTSVSLDYFNSKIIEVENQFKNNFEELKSFKFKPKHLFDEFMMRQRHLLDVINFLNECKHEYNANLLIQLYSDRYPGDINVT